MKLRVVPRLALVVPRPQKWETAEQPDMRESAIANGCVDFVMASEEIASEISRIAKEPSAARTKLPATAASV